MKNIKLTILVLFISTILFGQIDKQNYPFNITLLENISSESDSIMPTFINGKFYFINIFSRKKVLENGFDLAYPFIGKSALINIKGMYGIIDRNGKYLLEPTYQAVGILPNNYPESEPEKILLYNTWENPNNGIEEFEFNLRTGNGGEYIQIFGCIEYVFPKIYSFIGNNKYGIKNKKIIIEPIYDTILDINLKYIIAKKKSKIGIINGENKVLLPFKYKKILFKEYPFSTSIIGLKKRKYWEYYDNTKQNLNLILKSKIECINLNSLSLENSIGIFNRNGKFNILFKNGKTLPKDYDWLSPKGIIAIKERKVYLLSKKGVEFLYYEN